MDAAGVTEMDHKIRLDQPQLASENQRLMPRKPWTWTWTKVIILADQASVEWAPTLRLDVPGQDLKAV